MGACRRIHDDANLSYGPWPWCLWAREDVESLLRYLMALMFVAQRAAYGIDI